MTAARTGETLDDLLERVSRRRPPSVELGLERMERTLGRLGNPQRALPPVFHVAGTNGKGSTCAYLRAILEAAGASVHVYTSPHLVRYNERIVVAGSVISDAALIDAVQRADHAAGDDALTFFEALTCAGFLAFAETAADFLVLEVGLGGRLDATNVVETVLAAVIAPVSFDHQQFLGATLADIAAEKAGIIRTRAPAVIARQEPEAMVVLERRALGMRAPLFAYGQQWSHAVENGRLIYQDEDGLRDLAAPRLFGAHQFANAALAVAAVAASGLRLGDEVISAGLQNAVWPARLQRLKAGPLVDRLVRGPDGAGDASGDHEVWLDGGHNPHAAQALAAAMGELEERHSRPLILIAGMQETKDAHGFFTPFVGLARQVFTVQADHRGARAAEALAAAATAAGHIAAPCASLDEAARAARRIADGPTRFLICGSLYLAGEVLRDNA